MTDEAAGGQVAGCHVGEQPVEGAAGQGANATAARGVNAPVRESTVARSVRPERSKEPSRAVSTSELPMPLARTRTDEPTRPSGYLKVSTPA